MGIIYITGLNQTKYDQNLALFLLQGWFGKLFWKTLQEINLSQENTIVSCRNATVSCRSSHKMIAAVRV